MKNTEASGYKATRHVLNQNQHETKKRNETKNISNLTILEDQLVGPLLERGLQQPVVQPQVGCQEEVEDHRLVKQQAEKPYKPMVLNLRLATNLRLYNPLLKPPLKEPPNQPVFQIW